MGRPKLPARERKGRVVHIRLTAEDHRALRTEAKAAGVNLAAWMRRKLVGGAP
jgi:predicted HicB family RNase H-like nuclease